MSRREDKIPAGIYCHGKLIPTDDGKSCQCENFCPYWDVRKFHWWDMTWVIWRYRDILRELKNVYEAKSYWQLFKMIYKEEKEHGVYKCKYMHYKDTYQGESLLWDAVKECKVKEDEDE